MVRRASACAGCILFLATVARRPHTSLAFNHLRPLHRGSDTVVRTGIPLCPRGTRLLASYPSDGSPGRGDNIDVKRFDTEPVDGFAAAQISRIFGGSESRAFVALSLAGWSSPERSDGFQTLALSLLDDCQSISDTYRECLLTSKSTGGLSFETLPVPIQSSLTSSAVKLLSHAYSAQPLSKSVLLSLNSLLVNRDGGLFDNLPWSTWSIDPNLSERDAAGNVIEAKFTLGKRAAYQRFMGKDWQGRSLSAGNIANRIRWMLENDSGAVDDGHEGDLKTESVDDDMVSLSLRLLELEMKEAEGDIAECQKLLAIARTSDSSDERVTEIAALQIDQARERLQTAEASLLELTCAMSNSQARSDPQSIVTLILDKFTEQTNPPPFRGAIGYEAMLDTKSDVEGSVLPYTSPYELLMEIINEQLNSDIIGCVLEPTSLLDGNLVLGGALLLKRRGVDKSTTIAGEEVFYSDDNDDYGNLGILPRSMYVVECFVDEVVGVALEANLPLLVEESIHQRAGRIEVGIGENVSKGSGSDRLGYSFVDRVPVIQRLDGAPFEVQIEGERLSSEEDSNSVRVPISTDPQLFGGPGQVPESSAGQSTPVFSTFNPVESLEEYDGLSDDGKARLLLRLESFSGALPRPRALRQSASSDGYREGTAPTLLDDMLLPLIDESIRRRYQIRDAERRGDIVEAEELRRQVSRRQTALDLAKRARSEGYEDEAKRLEDEANSYKSSRADFTQDEGSYSRFLDRDDWYERETQARIKRLDKSKFGKLLDGIDLP